MKLNRAGLVVGLLAAGALALGACSSSGNGGGGNSTPAGVDTSSSGTAGGGITCSTGTLNGSGSTAQTNAMDQWRKDYQQACDGAQINYDSIGSGDGIAAFGDGTADFAGSDAALQPDDISGAPKNCASDDAIDLPMVVGPIAVEYNLQGVDSLTLDGPTVAQIFTGKITKWDDAAIKTLNPDANLPSTDITPFYRSDDSGTTFNFASYLAAAAPQDFTATPDKVSAGLGFKGQGREGSQGVTDAVTQTDGGVGYAELSYAAKAGLPTASIDSGSGPVELSKDTASAAIATAQVVGTGNDLSLKIDYGQNTAGAYPIVLVTYEIVCTKYKDAATAEFVKNFLTYTISAAGQGVLTQLGYAPVPDELATKVKASIATVS
ncbi:MAG: phosphate transport system substrate-binding protein [Pseudonocardiales bacterium]|nr:phosphate transport system substrate-binding protein [Pseudonocardiales bacterium]MDT4940792.1 phosphate transport system substrate-binding protein [Pseudonocardiales bacterium]